MPFKAPPTAQRARKQSTKRLYALVLAAIAGAFIVCVAMAPAGRDALKRLDADHFGYRLVDAYARLQGAESWDDAPQLPKGLSTKWATSPVLIAHGLGEWGGADANSPAALRRALDAGFSVVEIDISSDADGHARAFHGPGLAGADDWLIDDFLSFALPQPFYIVLDIKSDFDTIAPAILRRVRGSALEPRTIFQLYGREEIAWFAEAAVGTRLPAPIVTLYRSRRFKPHLLPNLRRIGAQIVTAPIERARELGDARSFALFLVHPVDECSAIPEVGADGGYISISTLQERC